MCLPIEATILIFELTTIQKVQFPSLVHSNRVWWQHSLHSVRQSKCISSTGAKGEEKKINKERKIKPLFRYAKVSITYFPKEIHVEVSFSLEEGLTLTTLRLYMFLNCTKRIKERNWLFTPKEEGMLKSLLFAKALLTPVSLWKHL